MNEIELLAMAFAEEAIRRKAAEVRAAGLEAENKRLAARVAELEKTGGAPPLREAPRAD